MSTTYFDTAIGIFIGYPWLNKPDTKFKDGGEYKAELKLTGDQAQTLKARVDTAVDEAFDAYCAEKGFGPKERKEWSEHHPYVVEEDKETGEPTGAVTFSFRQNASIVIRKTGEKIETPVKLYDSAGKEMTAHIFSGSEGRIRFSFRSAPQLSNKKVGVRLDLVAVQITKLAERSGGPGGFAPVPGGYVEESDPAKEREAAARRGFDAV